MKKLLYLAVAAIVGLTFVTACGNGSDKKVAETFTKQIANATNSADISGSFKVELGEATFTVYESETDSADFTVEVPVVAKNSEPVTRYEFIKLSMWYDTADGAQEKLFGDLPLSEELFPKVLEMDKAAVPTDTVMYPFNGRLPKATIDALRNATKVSVSSWVTNE